MPYYTLNPNSNSNTLWSAYDYANISKTTRYPTSPSLGTLCAAYSSDTGEKQQYGFEHIPTGTYGDVTVYYYYEDPTEINGLPIEVYIGGSWQTLVTNDTGNHSINWYYGTVSGLFTDSDINNLEVRLQCVDNGDTPQIYLYQLYIQVYYYSEHISNLGYIFKSRIFSNILTTDEEMKLC